MGVMDAATLSVITRWALREKVSNRAIAKLTGLSRNTIKKYPAAAVVDPRYAQRLSSSKLDPYADKLSQWLKAEQIKGGKEGSMPFRVELDVPSDGQSCRRISAELT